MWRDHLLAILALVLLPSLMSPSVAAAQGTDRMATATTLFEAGQALVQEGNAKEACPKFEESYRLVPANGTLINLADCYERVGRTASAWLKFREVATKSERDGQRARAEVARERVESLEPRLSKLRVVVGDNARLNGLAVERDGIALRSASFSVAVPVDPGEHRVVAKAPGHRPQTVVVMVQGEGVTVDAMVPRLSARTTEPEPIETPASSSGWHWPVGITALALGGAGVIVGVALGGAAKARADDADCDEANLCSPEGLTERDKAVDLGNIGTAVGIASAIVGAFGLTVVLTAPADDVPEVAVSLSPNSLGLRLRY